MRSSEIPNGINDVLSKLRNWYRVQDQRFSYLTTLIIVMQWMTNNMNKKSLAYLLMDFVSGGQVWFSEPFAIFIHHNKKYVP